MLMYIQRQVIYMTTIKDGKFIVSYVGVFWTRLLGNKLVTETRIERRSSNLSLKTGNLKLAKVLPVGDKEFTDRTLKQFTFTSYHEHMERVHLRSCDW